MTLWLIAAFLAGAVIGAAAMFLWLSSLDIGPKP